MESLDNAVRSDAMGTKPQRCAHAKNARLFLALWPDAKARRALEEYVASCAWPEGARLVAPEKFHVTLHFIGLFPADRIADLVRTLSVKFDAFELRLNRMELLRRGTVALVPDPVPREFVHLHRLTAHGLASAGIPTSETDFLPHLTLARKARGMHRVSSAAALQRVRWTVRSYDLVESTGGGRGYRIISRHDAALPE